MRLALTLALVLAGSTAAAQDIACVAGIDHIADAMNRLAAPAADFEGAERALLLALAACPDDPQVAALLGHAQIGTQRYVEAERHLASALARHAIGLGAGASRAERGAQQWLSDNRRLIEHHLAEARAFLGSLTVEANVPDAVAELPDGRRIVLPMSEPVRVQRGTFSLRVSAAGYVTASREVTVAAGASERASFTLVALPPPAPAEPVVVVRPEFIQRTVRPSPWRTAGWAAIGVGAASLVASMTFVGLTYDQQRRAEHPDDDLDYLAWQRLAYASGSVENACEAPRGTPDDVARVRDLCDRNDLYRGLAWGLGVGGALLLGGGIAAVLTARDRVDERRTTRLSLLWGGAARGLMVTIPFE